MSPHHPEPPRTAPERTVNPPRPADWQTDPDMPVLLIRHAHAGSRSEWTGHDAERGLSDRGRKQSKRLITTLRDFDVHRILSSPYVRCMDTVAPLAAARDLKVEPVDALAEGSGPDAIDLVRALAGHWSAAAR